MMTKRDAIDAALQLAEDLNDGKIDSAGLDIELASTCRALVGAVTGPDDALWPMQVDIARQAIALGALTADELSEWATVMRQRATEPPQTPDLCNDPPGNVSHASGSHSPGIGGLDRGLELEEGT